MNETIKSILSRRSVKEYRPEQIKAEELEMILLAGRYAPSGMNRQPWLFVVIQNKDELIKIKEILQKNMPAPPGGGRRPHLLETAPTLIIVFGQDGSSTTIHDCTLAMGNMMIAAASLGIGSNWIHAVVKDLFLFEEGKALKKEWGVSDEYVPYAAAVFGYQAKEPLYRPPRKEGVVKIIS